MPYGSIGCTYQLKYSSPNCSKITRATQKSLPFRKWRLFVALPTSYAWTGITIGCILSRVEMGPPYHHQSTCHRLHSKTWNLSASVVLLAVLMATPQWVTEISNFSAGFLGDLEVRLLLCIVHSMMYIVEACVCVYLWEMYMFCVLSMLVCKALRALREKGLYINVCYYYY